MISVKKKIEKGTKLMLEVSKVIETSEGSYIQLRGVDGLLVAESAITEDMRLPSNTVLIDDGNACLKKVGDSWFEIKSVNSVESEAADNKKITDVLDLDEE